MVYSTDASESGYGVTRAFFDRSCVAKMGRVRETAVFRLKDRHSARENALGSMRFVGKDVLGAGVEGGDDDCWERDECFPEVPIEVVDKRSWVVCMSGKCAFFFDDTILRLEAHAFLKAMRRLAHCVFGNCVRQVFLVDNMSVCLSFNRCRARNFRLLKIIRRFRSYCFARGIFPSVRWIPSEFNSSDGASRIFCDKSAAEQVPIDIFRVVCTLKAAAILTMNILA
jgi:hypothetical protein